MENFKFLENANTVFPHIVPAETILFWIWPYVLWPLVTVHKCAETIQGRKLFKGGKYMRKYGIWKKIFFHLWIEKNKPTFVTSIWKFTVRNHVTKKQKAARITLHISVGHLYSQIQNYYQFYKITYVHALQNIIWTIAIRWTEKFCILFIYACFLGTFFDTNLRSRTA